MCEVKGCEKDTYICYRGRKVCCDHWIKHCDERRRFSLKTCEWKRRK
jgi:hypothetical protein